MITINKYRTRNPYDPVLKIWAKGEGISVEYTTNVKTTLINTDKIDALVRLWVLNNPHELTSFHWDITKT